MPSGKVHDKITVAAAAVTAPGWLLISPVPRDWGDGIALIGALLFSGLLLSPDLDLNSSIYKRWGPLRFIWWPYQKIVPHRSDLSHSFVLGPVLRVLYFLFMLWALFRIVTWALSFVIALDRGALTRHTTDVFVGAYQTHPHQLIMVGVGLFIGTALHLIADIIGTRIKRSQHGHHRPHRRH